MLKGRDTIEMITFIINKIFSKNRDESLELAIDSLQKRDWKSFEEDMSKIKKPLLKNLLHAIKMYQQHNFFDAQESLKPLLSDKNYLPSALLVLGFLHDEQHAYALAIRAFSRYVELKPKEVDVNIFICELYIKVKKNDLAHQCLLTTLNSPYTTVDTLAQCTKYFLRLRDGANAMSATHKAFMISVPTLKEIRTLLNAFVSTGSFSMADTLFELLYTQRFKSQGELPRYYADTYFEKKKYDRAIALYRLMLKSEPKDAKSYHSMAQCYQAQNDYKEAIKYFQKSIKLDPLEALSYTHLAMAYGEIEAYQDAIKMALKSIEIEPTIEAYSALGQDYYRTRQFDLALEVNQKALALSPYNQSIHWNQSLLYLVQGDLEKGFFHYETRFSPGNPRKIKLPLGGVAIWNGESLEGKTLYVYDEQGNGDTIVFVRFLPMVMKLAHRVVFHSRGELEPIFNNPSNREFFEGVEIINRETNPQPQIRFDYQIPLMSLAHRLGTRVESIPFTDRYLKASPDMVNKWAKLVASLTDKRLKVALTWSGNPNYIYDKYRSLQTHQIATFLNAHRDVAFFALTKGGADESLKTTYAHLPLIRVAEYLDSFDDTAGLIANVDLVISVDTAVAHLGASMGRETWVLLYHFPFWIWGTGENSPWYTHTKLYQQKRALEWDEVLGSVSDDLTIFKQRSYNGL